jgi:hypothetical protein
MTKSQLETLPTTTNRFTYFVVLLVIYRVIQEEQSIFLEVVVLAIVKKKSLYEHVSNSLWLLRSTVGLSQPKVH